MESKRQNKMASLLKETMSEILLKEGGNIYGRNVLVSITQAKVTPDVSIVRFYISTFNAENNEHIVALLNDNAPLFRKYLGNVLRNHLRKIPEIEFYYDDTLEYAQKMNELFNKINEEKKGSDQ